MYDARCHVQHVASLYASFVTGVQSWMTIKKTEISAQHEFLKANISTRI